MTSPYRYTSSRAHYDVTGITKSGLSWSEINGPIRRRRNRALVKLLAGGAGLTALFLAAGVVGAMV